MVRKNLLLVIILSFGFLLRVILLNRFPIGITHDELNYIIAAKSLLTTGSFAPGTAPSILPTTMAQFTVTVAEVPALLLALFIGFFETSLFTSRILGAILSTSSILAVYLLVKRLTGKKLYALICSAVMAANPWSFLMGRTIFEVNFFTAFFLWGFLVLLSNKGWKIFYALPLYLLGFFSYIGGQVSFYLFIVITLIFHYFETPPAKRFLKPYLLFTAVVTLILVGYFAVIFTNQSFAARGAEILMPSNSQIVKTVDEGRQLSVQSPFNQVFVNKYTVYLRSFFEKYLNAFSVNSLFVNGEFRAAFSFQQHGTFYILDFIFILLGLSFLFGLNKKAWFLIVAIIAAAPITSGVSLVEYSYSQRAGLMFPFIIILCGLGISYITTLSNKHRLRSLLLAIIAIAYGLMFVNMLHIYFYRFPVYASDGWFFQDRILSRYIRLTTDQNPNTKIIVTTIEPKIIFQEYLFFNQIYEGKRIKDINERMDKKDYLYGNVDFINSCPVKQDASSVWISDGSVNCGEGNTKDLLRITRLKDIHEDYLIKGDLICSNQPIGAFVLSSAYKNFDIENQEIEVFCRNWITKL